MMVFNEGKKERKKITISRGFISIRTLSRNTELNPCRKTTAHNHVGTYGLTAFFREI